ncbi:hypothetical protein PG990_015367 [Apiospora arundinis]
MGIGDEYWDAVQAIAVVAGVEARAIGVVSGWIRGERRRSPDPGPPPLVQETDHCRPMGEAATMPEEGLDLVGPVYSFPGNFVESLDEFNTIYIVARLRPRAQPDGDPGDTGVESPPSATSIDSCPDRAGYVLPAGKLQE